MKKYWEEEQPVAVDSERTNIKWYPVAQRLTIELKPWVKPDKTEMKGLMMYLNVHYLRSLPAEQREVLETIFSAVTESVAVRSG